MGLLHLPDASFEVVYLRFGGQLLKSNHVLETVDFGQVISARFVDVVTPYKLL